MNFVLYDVFLDNKNDIEMQKKNKVNDIIILMPLMVNKNVNVIRITNTILFYLAIANQKWCCKKTNEDCEVSFTTSLLGFENWQHNGKQILFMMYFYVVILCLWTSEMQIINNVHDVIFTFSLLAMKSDSIIRQINIVYDVIFDYPVEQNFVAEDITWHIHFVYVWWSFKIIMIVFVML